MGQKLLLPTFNGTRVIEQNEIIFAKADNKTTILYMACGKEELVNQTLKVFESTAGLDFHRCHRSYLVNINHIQETLQNNTLIKLTSGVEVPVSIRKKKVLIELLTVLCQTGTKAK